MKKKKRKEKRPAAVLAVSALGGWAVFAAALLAGAYILTKFDAPAWVPGAAMLAAAALGAFAAAFIGRRDLRYRPVLPAALAALCYLLPLAVAVLLVNGFSVSTVFFLLFPAGCLGAAVGGVTAAYLSR